jgi:hypothetical protein
VSLAATGIPWPTVLVGLAGIVGALGGVYLTNRAASEREKRAQEHEDRTRFHKERLEIYARFLRASRMCRDNAYKSVPLTLRNYGAPIPQSDQVAILERYVNSWGELTEASEMVSLVASLPVKEVADTVTELARAIVAPNPDWTAEQLNSRNNQLAEFEAAFRRAARGELLPAPIDGGSATRPHP